MITKKKIAKTIKAAKTIEVDDIATQLHSLAKQVEQKFKKTKAAYQHLTPDAKKKVIASIAGAAALLAGMRAIKNHAQETKKKVM